MCKQHTRNVVPKRSCQGPCRATPVTSNSGTYSDSRVGSLMKGLLRIQGKTREMEGQGGVSTACHTSDSSQETSGTTIVGSSACFLLRALLPPSCKCRHRHLGLSGPAPGWRGPVWASDSGRGGRDWGPGDKTRPATVAKGEEPLLLSISNTMGG